MFKSIYILPEELYLKKPDRVIKIIQLVTDIMKENIITDCKFTSQCGYQLKYYAPISDDYLYIHFNNRERTNLYLSLNQEMTLFVKFTYGKLTDIEKGHRVNDHLAKKIDQKFRNILISFHSPWFSIHEFEVKDNTKMENLYRIFCNMNKLIELMICVSREVLIASIRTSCTYIDAPIDFWNSVVSRLLNDKPKCLSRYEIEKELNELQQNLPHSAHICLDWPLFQTIRLDKQLLTIPILRAPARNYRSLSFSNTYTFFDLNELFRISSEEILENIKKYKVSNLLNV